MNRISIIIIILTFSISSCKKKTLELPIIPISGITAISNFSEIWVFYNSTEEKRKAVINKNNTISTTNWIINIDKRLTMKEVVPVLEMIKTKRAKKSIHSAEGVKNYLSYANEKDKNISLFSNDSIQYMILDKSGFDDLSYHYNADYILKLNELNFEINDKAYEYNKFNKELFDSLPTEKMHLFFHSNISYNRYLEIRIKVEKTTEGKFEIDPTEYMLHFQ